MNWIIRTAQNKGNAEKLSDVLAKEIIDAAKNQVCLYDIIQYIILYNVLACYEY